MKVLKDKRRERTWILPRHYHTTFADVWGQILSAHTLRRLVDLQLSKLMDLLTAKKRRKDRPNYRIRLLWAAIESAQDQLKEISATTTNPTQSTHGHASSRRR
jgi:hypothetical protein